TVLDGRGQIAGDAEWTYPTHHPRPGYSEQHPEDWFNSMCQCFRQLDEQGVSLDQIQVMALDGSTHNAVLLDENYQVIRPVIMWTDQRSSQEVAELKRLHGEEIFNKTYQQVSTTWTLPQLLWLKKQEPGNFFRIARIMFVKDYVRFLLCGIWATDHIDAQGSMLYDMTTRTWSEELCALIDLPTQVLPPIYAPVDLVGKITREAARKTGLREGVPVVCGTTDVTAEAFGAGAVLPGQCILKLATAGNVNVMTSDPRPSPKTLTYSHVVPGLWYTASATSSAAAAMRWFKDQFGFDYEMQSRSSPSNVYKYIDTLAKDSPAGSRDLIFHPYLSGERAPYWDPYLKASFTGISAYHTRGDFSRAVMEGVAFSLKDCFRLIEDMNLTVSEFLLIGGGARSDVWAQIVSDVFGKTVLRPKQTDASFGSALLAGVALGIFSSEKEAVRRCVAIDREFTPDPDIHQLYQRQFRLYRKIHDLLEAVYHEIVKVKIEI
ncbi:MAG TPA: xylulokinase, partial [Membranihabitans sp.]|nr:xylulokinase [Membranihabitans sp.]